MTDPSTATLGEKTLLYASANGDRWFYLRSGNAGGTRVRHEPNCSSGGLPTETDVEDFLSRDGQGPQHDALRRLLG
jgi:hypothetical protein